MKKKSKKKEFAKTLLDLGTVVNLKDSPTEVTHYMGVPVEGERGKRSSRILVPTSKNMPVIPPDIEHSGAAADHNRALVELAKTIVPTDKDLAKAKATKFRSDQLEKLDEILSGRRSNHGSPENNFAKIAEAWNMWLRWRGVTVNLAPSDVPIMMSLLKLAREASGHSEDSAVDAAGYFLIYNELKDRNENKSTV